MDEKKTRCHFCKKPGHLKKNRFAYKKKQMQKNQKPDPAEVTEKVEGTDVLNVVENNIGDEWILDSGCSFHMCPHKGWFLDLKYERL